MFCGNKQDKSAQRAIDRLRVWEILTYIGGEPHCFFGLHMLSYSCAIGFVNLDGVTLHARLVVFAAHAARKIIFGAHIINGVREFFLLHISFVRRELPCGR